MGKKRRSAGFDFGGLLPFAIIILGTILFLMLYNAGYDSTVVQTWFNANWH